MAETTQENTELSQATKDTIRKEVQAILRPWLRWIGITNAAGLIGIISYLAITLPNKVETTVTQFAEQEVTRVVSSNSQLVTNLDVRLKELDDDLIENMRIASSVKARYENVEREVNKMQTDLDQIQDANLDLNRISLLAKELGEYPSIQEVLQKLRNLEQAKITIEQTLLQLGQKRTNAEFTIDNSRMPLRDSATCPVGSFVSAIHASGAVGGDLAVDGISQIKFSCSPIR